MKWLWICLLFLRLSTFAEEPVPKKGSAAIEGKKVASMPMAWTSFSLSFLMIVGIGVAVAVYKDHHDNR